MSFVGSVFAMDDPAYPSRLKIGRAKQHINELGLAVENFMERRPFRLIVKHRPQAGEYLIVTKRYEPIPDTWSLMIAMPFTIFGPR